MQTSGHHIAGDYSQHFNAVEKKKHFILQAFVKLFVLLQRFVSDIPQIAR